MHCEQQQQYQRRNENIDSKQLTGHLSLSLSPPPLLLPLSPVFPPFLPTLLPLPSGTYEQNASLRIQVLIS